MSGGRSSAGRARYRSRNEQPGLLCVSVCDRHTPASLQLTNKHSTTGSPPLCQLWTGQTCFKFPPNPPRGLSAENTKVDECYWKKKKKGQNTDEGHNLQWCCVWCSCHHHPSEQCGQPGVVWSPPHTCQALGQDDCLGGLPSREC